MVRTLQEGEVLPHPAEDLSADDDLLSWILVDQLGCLPNTKLGVHPQQVKFVGPVFKTSEILAIVQETVVNTDLPEATRRLLDFHLIKGHLDTKVTEGQRERFIQHLRRYLLPLLPTSRIEIYTTDRYTSVTGHVELAVYATRPIPAGAVLQELQGSVVPLPDLWREEMELGEDFLEAAGEEGSDEESGAEEDEEEEEELRSRRAMTSQEDHGGPSRKGKRKKEPKGARRSDRTKRRDFSIVWSGLKRCYQLFLGPARFLNHDCNPNVELLRQGKYVTFRVIRPIRIGDEITTFYGDCYFGKDNIECLCLTCEKQCKGGFTGKELELELDTRSRSPSMSSSTRVGSPMSSRKPVKPSALRNALSDLNLKSQLDDFEPDDEAPIAGPSGTQTLDSEPVTPRKLKHNPSFLSVGRMDSPATDATSDPGSPSEGQPPKRERYQRKAARNAQHFSFLKRPKKVIEVMPELDQSVMDEEDDDCVRCATCARALHERIWYNNRYFDHCARCVRHSLIFDLPWPAHRSSEVLEYPPSHLIPYGYIPPRVSTIALPSLDKNRRKHVEPAPVSPVGETLRDRYARIFRDAITLAELQEGQLREEVFTIEDTRITQRQAAEQAKIDAREKRLEEKRLRDVNKVKGTGVWQRYEYIDEEEIKKREAAKYAVTTGTRRGGRFRAVQDEEEERRLQAEVAARLRQQAHQEMGAGEDDADDEADSADEGQLADPIVEDQALVSPTIRAPKLEPPDSATRIGRIPAGVIDLTGDSEEDDSDVALLGDDGTTSLFAAAAKTKEKSHKAKKKKANGDDDDSDIQEVPHTPRKNGKSVTPHINGDVSSAIRPGGASVTNGNLNVLKALISPVRRAAKTKPKAKSKSAATIAPPRVVDKVPGTWSTHETGPDTADAARLESAAENERRGRGRPSGTGRKQKAAVLLAGRAAAADLPVAGPSGTSKQRSSPAKPAADEVHIQTRIEALLSKNEHKIKFQYMIEGLDEDGKFCLKRTGFVGTNQYDTEDAIEAYITKERLEYEAYLKGKRHPNGNGNGGTESIHNLPGSKRLLSGAEVKAWSPSRTKLPLPLESPVVPPAGSKYSVPPGLQRDVEVVGLIHDPGTSRDYGRPSMTEGPWLNGQFRIVAALETNSEAGDPVGQAPTVLPEVRNGEGNGKSSSNRVNGTPAKTKITPASTPNVEPQTNMMTQRNGSIPLPSLLAKPFARAADIPKPRPSQTVPHVNGSAGVPLHSTTSTKITRVDSWSPATSVKAEKSLAVNHDRLDGANHSVDYENGNSAGTSLAEDEVEEVLEVNPKRKLSVSESKDNEPPLNRRKTLLGH